MGSFCALPSAFLIFGLRLRRSHTKRPLRCEVSPKALLPWWNGSSNDAAR